MIIELKDYYNSIVNVKSITTLTYLPYLETLIINGVEIKYEKMEDIYEDYRLIKRLMLEGE